MVDRGERDASCAVHRVGRPISFSGYVDDFDRGVSAIQFSLDDAVIDKGVNWHFDYTPTRPGRYVLKARAVDKRGVASVLVSRFAFEVLP